MVVNDQYIGKCFNGLTSGMTTEVHTNSNPGCGYPCSFEINTGTSSQCTWGQGLWSCSVGYRPFGRPWWTMLRPSLVGGKLLLLSKSSRDTVRASKPQGGCGEWRVGCGEGESGTGEGGEGLSVSF